MHPIVFLLGMHGSGKTSVGRDLQQNHGFKHISLGDLGRLARARKSPKDFSLRLMCLLAGHKPDQPFREETVTELLKEIQNLSIFGPVSVDGFPSEAKHIAFLPAKGVTVYLEVSESTREQRLVERSHAGPRKWTPGQKSFRDENLKSVLDTLGNDLKTIDASRELALVVLNVLKQIPS